MIEKSIFYRNMELLTDKGVKKVHELSNDDSILVLDGTGFVTFTDVNVGHSGTCSHFNIVRSSLFDITLSEWMALPEYHRDGDRMLSAAEVRDTLMDRTSSIRLNTPEPFVGVTEMPDDFFASAWVYHIVAGINKEIRIEGSKASSRLSQVSKILKKYKINHETVKRDGSVYFVFEKDFGVRKSLTPRKTTMFNMMSRRQAVIALEFEALLMDSSGDDKTKRLNWSSDFTSPLLLKAGYSPRYAMIGNTVSAGRAQIVSTEFWSVYNFENQYEDITIDIDSSIKAIFMKCNDIVIPVQNMHYI